MYITCTLSIYCSLFIKRLLLEEFYLHLDVSFRRECWKRWRAMFLLPIYLREMSQQPLILHHWQLQMVTMK